MTDEEDEVIRKVLAPGAVSMGCRCEAEEPCKICSGEEKNPVVIKVHGSLPVVVTEVLQTLHIDTAMDEVDQYHHVIETVVRAFRKNWDLPEEALEEVMHTMRAIFPEWYFSYSRDEEERVSERESCPHENTKMFRTYSWCEDCGALYNNRARAWWIPGAEE
jgi:hypothetical protein